MLGSGAFKEKFREKTEITKWPVWLAFSDFWHASLVLT